MLVIFWAGVMHIAGFGGNDRQEVGNFHKRGCGVSEEKQNINTIAADLITHIQMTMRNISDDRVREYLEAMIDGIKALQERMLK